MMDHKIVENCDIGAETDIEQFAVLYDCIIGEKCHVWRFTNLYGTDIGDNCMIGSFVEIQEDSVIGDGCRIQSHAFVCSLVTLHDNVFVSHGAKFINDLYPPSGDRDQWQPTDVGDGASIGTNATVLPVEIGENALIAAGSVVVDDVPPNAIVAGNPAEVVGYRDEQ